MLPHIIWKLNDSATPNPSSKEEEDETIFSISNDGRVGILYNPLADKSAGLLTDPTSLLIELISRGASEEKREELARWILGEVGRGSVSEERLKRIEAQHQLLLD